MPLLLAIGQQYASLFIENNNKKSIPYSYIEEKGYQIEYSYNPILNYINTLDNVYFKGEIKNEKD